MAKKRTVRKTATKKGVSVPLTTREDLRRQIIAKAIVDPAFRKRLLSEPEVVFEGEVTAADMAALQRIQKMLPALDDIVHNLAGRSDASRLGRLRTREDRPDAAAGLGLGGRVVFQPFVLHRV